VPGVLLRGDAATRLGAQAAFTPSYSTGGCSNTYCHGKFPGGSGYSVDVTVSWTGGAAACGSCHALPPTVLSDGTSPHASGTDCGGCHTGYTLSSVNPATHVDGSIDVAGGCTGCHGTTDRPNGDMPVGTYDANQASAPPVVTPGHASSSAFYVGAHLSHVNPSTGGVYPPIACTECHPDNTVPPHPSNGLTMTFAAATGANLAGYPASFVQGDGATTATSCSTYCHQGAAGGSVATWAWNGGAADCGSCHGFPPALLSDGTTPHKDSAACGDCHSGYTGVAVNLATHIDGTVESSTSCTSCHGDETRPDGGMAAATYDANQASAPPVDFDGASTGVLVGAHLSHVNPDDTGIYKPILCTECHPDNTVGNHPNGGATSVTFAAATGADLDGYVPTRTLGNGTSTPTTCATYCHNGAGAGSVATWSWNGAAATCGSCHGNPPAFQSDGTTPHTSSTACEGCHAGYTNASVARATHINGTIEVAGCTGCHGTDGRANGNMAGVTYDPNQASAPPAATALHGAANGVLIGVHLAHVNPDSTGVYKPIACVECHPDNTSGAHPDNAQAQVNFTLATAADLAGFLPGATLGNGSSTPTTCTSYCHNGPFAAGYGGSASAWSWNGSAATCGSCHGDPPATSGHVGLDATTNCGGCHPGYTATTVDLATHINGRLDGGESVGGQPCGGCHKTIFERMNGTISKNFKHTLGTSSGINDAFADSGISWGNPLTGNAAAARSCVNMCHGDHPHDLTSPLVTTHEYNAYLDSSSASGRGGTSRTSTSRNNTDFAVAETNGGLCVSCHRSPVSAGRPGIDKAIFGASAHDFTAFTSGSTWTWQFQLHSGNFDRNCTKCHSSAAEGTTPASTANSSGTNSVHFNDNPSLLAGKTNPASAGADGFVCFNCHGSATPPTDGAQGNRSGKNIQTELGRAYNHPVLSDAVHDTVAEAAAAWNDGKFKGANRHVNCADCHDPHAAASTKHAVGTSAIAATSPLRGVAGVGYTPPATNWTATGSGNFSLKAIATAEYELCFKCHSSFAFGGTPPTGQSGLVETDVAQDFNPNNHSVHPIAGPNTYWPLNQPAVRLGGQWTAGVGQTMYCSDCHGATATTGAQGPHGSAAKFMLKGSPSGAQTYWPTDASGTAYYELGGTLTGLFCLNCHPNLNSTVSPNSNTLHRNGNHRGQGFACIDCHVRVPHGGKIPRLLITDTAGLPSRLKDPNAWVTSGRTPNFDNGGGAAPPTAFGRSATLTNDMGTSKCTACNQHTCNTTGGGTCESW